MGKCQDVSSYDTDILLETWSWLHNQDENKDNCCWMSETATFYLNISSLSLKQQFLYFTNQGFWDQLQAFLSISFPVIHYLENWMTNLANYFELNTNEHGTN